MGIEIEASLHKTRKYQSDCEMLGELGGNPQQTQTPNLSSENDN